MIHNEEYLYLVWKDPRTRRNFTVGKLTRGEEYTFSYLEDISAAESHGWSKLEAFPEVRVYRSKVIFPVFASRLPDRKRRDLDKILQKYGLEEFDEFEMLKKSGARLPIDTYEFINPIFPEDETVQRDFYVMAIPYSAGNTEVNCGQLQNVNVGDLLQFVPEPKNDYDPLAIRVLSQDGAHLGYIPRYYNKEILARLNKGMTYSCEVIEIEYDCSTSECIKVRVKMPCEG